MIPWWWLVVEAVAICGVAALCCWLAEERQRRFELEFLGTPLAPSDDETPPIPCHAHGKTCRYTGCAGYGKCLA